MQPSLSTEYPNAMKRHDVRIHPMSAPPLAASEATNSSTALALRLAQRAFAACMEDAPRKSGDGSALCAAKLRSAARRTLSALSADDRSSLDRWLILQFATGVAPGSAVASRWLARVDSRLSANNWATVGDVREELCTHAGSGAAA